MKDDIVRSAGESPAGLEPWESPRLVLHGLLSEITLDSGPGIDDFLGDNGTASPS